jgi:hypothetical protein
VVSAHTCCRPFVLLRREGSDWNASRVMRDRLSVSEDEVHVADPRSLILLVETYECEIEQLRESDDVGTNEQIATLTQRRNDAVAALTGLKFSRAVAGL